LRVQTRYDERQSQGLGARRHFGIIWALLLREVATRYGRRNLGFLWLLGEPLLFCLGVLALWTVIRPPYEHGIKVIPFVLTGYMPIILVRHMVTHAVNCVRANSGLLYHRHITLMHLFSARLALEFIGVSLSFLVVAVVLGLFGLIDFPPKLHLVYGGWLLMAWTAFGLAMILGALSEIYEVMERFVALFTYILVPVSGTFYMAAWIPAQYREVALTLPLLHSVEMIRGGFLGDQVQVFYNPVYAIAWAAGLTFVGLLTLRFVRDRVEVE
jgi:capsular polysaccharide transport system permease protein